MENMLFEIVDGQPLPRLDLSPSGDARHADGARYFNLEQALKRWPTLTAHYLQALWTNSLGEQEETRAEDDEADLATDGRASEPVVEAEAPAPTTPVVASRIVSSVTPESIRQKYWKFNDIEFAEIIAQNEALGFHPMISPLIPQRQPDPDTGELKLVFIMTAQAFLAVAHRSGDFKGFGPVEFASRDGVWKEHWPEDTHPFKGRCPVYRGDTTHCWAVHWRDVVQYLPPKPGDTEPRLTHFWAERWTNQFGKCCLVASLRKAYPNLGRLYLREELATSRRGELGSNPAGQTAKPERDPYSQIPSYDDSYSQI